MLDSDNEHFELPEDIKKAEHYKQPEQFKLSDAGLTKYSELTKHMSKNGDVSELYGNMFSSLKVPVIDDIEDKDIDKLIDEEHNKEKLLKMDSFEVQNDDPEEENDQNDMRFMSTSKKKDKASIM
jgi:hypothetical protein